VPVADVDLEESLKTPTRTEEEMGKEVETALWGLNPPNLVISFSTLLTECPQGVYARELMNDAPWPVSKTPARDFLF
jgi:hypothetical protein